MIRNWSHRRVPVVWGLLLAAVVCLFGSCRREPSEGSPVTTESSVHVLEERAKAALAEIDRARSQPNEAREALQRARSHVDVLLRYHLPLLEARERSANAYRLYQLGRVQESLAELDASRALLEGIATDQPGLAKELEQPRGTLLRVRTLLEAEGSPQEIRARFDRLLGEIHALEVKAYLVLRGTPWETP